jgi:hypothetical protein
MTVLAELTFQMVDADGNATAICGIPLIRAVTVFFLPTDAEESRNAASSLMASVRDFLLRLTPSASECAPHCAHALDTVPDCPECSSTNREKLLVLMCKKSAHSDTLPNSESPFAVPQHDWWLSDDEHKRVLPVCESGAHPTAWLPKPFWGYNAYFWNASPVEATPVVLSAASVTSDLLRIFVSYRRLETQPLAEQLFEELNRQGFDVFLDRYSVPAASKFQRRLHHELAEKSMVLLLESDRFGESKWTSEEIAYCKQYRLGLYVLQMPHGRELDPNDPAGKARKKTRRLPDVDDDLRTKLELDDFSSEPHEVDAGTPARPDLFLQWGQLTDVALAKIAVEIKARHDSAMLRRLHSIRKQMLESLALAGATDSRMRADGMLVVNGGARSYAVWITTHPPELPDFYVAHSGSTDPAGTVGVIVGHRELLEPETHRRLVWLSGVCRLVLVDEGRIVSAAFDMAGGVL